METLYYSTGDYHDTNSHTMDDFLDNKFLERFNIEDEIIFQDGSYAEVKTLDGEIFAVHASGNGDCYNHKIEFKKL